jgi:dihydroxyacid dehydratase/phosphogluconate dehydratase
MVMISHYIDVNVNVNSWMVVKCDDKKNSKPKIVIVTSYQHLLPVSCEVQNMPDL